MEVGGPIESLFWVEDGVYSLEKDHLSPWNMAQGQQLQVILMVACVWLGGELKSQT